MRWFFLLFFLSRVCLAQGGPPLITDDPGTPGDGNWEINLATIGIFTTGQRLIQIPYIDVNYGLGDRIQLKLETGWSFLLRQSDGMHSGAGPEVAGVKWRFVDQKDAGISFSTYPQYEFRSFFTLKDPILNIPGSTFLLPLEASKEMGAWAINPEIGYKLSTRSLNQWIFGIVGSFQPEKDFELLAELHASTTFDGNGTASLFNIGTRYPFSRHVVLLFSTGRTLTSFQGSPYQVFGYLGTQLRL